MGNLFFSILYSLTLHKSPQIFNIASHTQASSNERTQWNQLQKCNLLVLWSPSNPDIFGTRESGWISEVSSFQELVTWCGRGLSLKSMM